MEQQPLARNLKVTICAVGSQVTYDFIATSLDSSGFFVEYENPGRFPFSSDSLLEVWVDIQDGRVFFLGKIGRVVYPRIIESLILPGVQIISVSIDRKYRLKLDEFLRRKHKELEMKKEIVA